MPMLSWHIKSTSQGGRRPLRLRHRAAPERQPLRHRRRLRHPPLHQARSARPGASPPTERHVLLIDEIDKADLEFPNDLLRELDEMRFTIIETGEEIVAQQRPVVLITSNNEKELPDAFLRRCIFHYIEFPDVAADAQDRRRAPPAPRRQAARSGADQVLLAARAERAAQEAVDLRADRLDQRAAALRHQPWTSSRRTSRSSARCSRRSRTSTRSRATTSGAASYPDALGRPRAALQPVGRARTMFLDLFYGLRDEGVPVAIQEWQTLPAARSRRGCTARACCASTTSGAPA